MAEANIQMKQKKRKLIPFTEIDADAREIAVAWVGKFKPQPGMQIEQKHKLASDIVLYGNDRTKSLMKEFKDFQKESVGIILHNKMINVLINCYSILIVSPVRFKELEAEVYALISSNLMKIAKEKRTRFDSALMDLEDFKIAHPNGVNAEENTKLRKLKANMKFAEEDYNKFIKTYQL